VRPEAYAVLGTSFRKKNVYKIKNTKLAGK
jgi:hypothetical protein